ncbi:hypothetical protein C8Q77DRAFT_1054282, partial [Trametes polyzona]
RHATMTYFACSALLSYDYILTFGREVNHIWRRGFSSSALLFYAARYSAFFNIAFAVMDLSPWPSMTAYALSARNRVVLVVVLVLGIVNPALVLVCTGLFVLRPVVTMITRAATTTRFPTSNTRRMIGARLSGVLVDAVVLAITWKRLWSATRRESAPQTTPATFTSVLLRDGAFLDVVALLIANLIGLFFIRDIDLLEPASTWISALTAIMTWRFILDLHEADDAMCDAANTGVASTMPGGAGGGRGGVGGGTTLPELVFCTDAQSAGVFGAIVTSQMSSGEAGDYWGWEDSPEETNEGQDTQEEDATSQFPPGGDLQVSAGV